jgi:pimeloyl-ACP methyl ester carboxylesterase
MTPPATPSLPSPYIPRRAARSLFVPIRGLRYHVMVWGDPSMVTPETPPLVLVHGWMDVGASFQFVVDALDALGEAGGPPRYVIAPDWRGFGRTAAAPGTDTYWFPDYLGDLDALLCSPGLGLQALPPIDLVGHSMGGNVVMMYAGIRPERIRRLVNLEGFGLPQSTPDQAPRRYAQWLDQLREPSPLRDYDSLDAVAARLMKNNPLLRPDFADWLAPHWSARNAAGRWAILGDPAHKHVNPALYRKEEVLACWTRITAPVLWVEGDQTDVSKWWGNRYPRTDFEERLAVVPRLVRHLLSPCGHMLHHDQPDALAALVAGHLGSQPGYTT